jgi:hypothetical protein
MYTIIVAEDDSKNASGLEMANWRDVQAYSVWPPFQVTGICIAAFLNQCLSRYEVNSVAVFEELEILHVYHHNSGFISIFCNTETDFIHMKSSNCKFGVQGIL